MKEKLNKNINKKNTPSSKLTAVCSKCGKKVFSIYTVSDSETTVCLDCYKKYFYRCSKCGKIKCSDSGSEGLRYSNSYLVYYDVKSGKNCFICGDCKEKNTAINYSTYTPPLKFHADDLIIRFFGIELEVDRGSGNREINNIYENREGHVYNILNIANKNDTEKNLYVKNDSSLNYGFEMVTHPMTLSYHMNNMPWKEIMSYLTDVGYLSHNTETCGLHIHVNRNSLGYSKEEQQEAIARLIYFSEKYKEKLFILSRRTKTEINEWAGWYGRRDKPEDYKSILNSYGNEKYRTINLSHEETVEFRLYKGTLNYNTFIASIQLTNELCRIAAIISNEDIVKLSWEDFIKSIDPEKNIELMQYLKDRKIYSEKKGGSAVCAAYSA